MAVVGAETGPATVAVGAKILTLHPCVVWWPIHIVLAIHNVFVIRFQVLSPNEPMGAWHLSWLPPLAGGWNGRLGLQNP